MDSAFATVIFMFCLNQVVTMVIIGALIWERRDLKKQLIRVTAIVFEEYRKKLDKL